MPYCQHCGAQVREGAKFCQECGKPPFGNAQSVTPQPTPSVAQPRPEKRKRPIIGFIGMILLIIGVIVVFSNVTAGLIVGVIGLAVLVFALFTGNVKLFG